MTDRVDKRLGLGLLKRPAKAAGPIIRTGVTRAGTVGVEIEHKGVKGWGASETAARANWQQNRAMGNGVSVGKRVTDDDVAKGFLTQSTKPVLARTTPAAGRMLARPTGKVVKADVSKLGLMSAGKLIPKVAGAGWKAGRTGARPKMGLHAATAVMGSSNASRGLRAIGTGAKMAGEHPVATGLGTGIVGGSVLGAGYAHRQVEKASRAVLTSRLMRSTNPTVKARLARRAEEVDMQDLKRDPVYRRILGSEPFERRSHRKSVNFVERFRYNPETGRRELPLEGLNTSRPRGRSLTASDKEYLGLPGGSGGGTLQGTGGLAHGQLIDYPLNGNKRVRKAYGDPEDARYFRLGAGAAVLGGGGLAGLALGGRQIARDTKRERNRFKDVHDIDLPTKPHFDPATHKPGGPQEAKLRGWQKMERAKTVVADAKNTKRLKGAVVIHGRAAGLLGGGAAALGGAEMLRRRASERRYN